MKGKKTPATGITLYAELSKAGGDITPNEGESKTDFFVRLTETVSELDDAVYDALSPAAQKWFNASGEAINANNLDKIPDLPGMPEISEEAAPADEEDGDADEKKPASPVKSAAKPKVNKETEMKGKKTSAKPAAAKPAAKAAPAAKKTPAKSGTRGRTAANADGDAIKVLVKDNPKRAGSDSFKRFALYAKNKTVGAFLKAGGTRADLRYDSEHKFIAVG